VLPLTPGAALVELLARLCAAPGRVLALSADELQHWPDDAVLALKTHGVLRPGKPGDTAVCPGCERACVMPVQQRQRPGRQPVAFVVCDKRDDIGRVPLVQAHLERWRADGQTLGDALAGLLGAGACHPLPALSFVFRLGMVAGAADKAPVQLRFDEHGHALLDVAGHGVELAAVLAIQGVRLVLDTRHLGRCADAPAGGAALAAETAAQRSARLLARKAVLQQRGVKAFLAVLAAEEGVSVSMVKRILGRVQEPAAPPLPAWAAVVAPPGGVSADGKRKR
jgi:hypothetical protein